MKKTTIMDVLVVYNHAIASSASNTNKSYIAPFSGKSQNYNDAYAYFLETCYKMNINAAFTTSSDFKKGKFRSYWIYNQKQWKKIHESCVSLFIFDKFAPTTKKIKAFRADLFNNVQIKPFNNPELFTMFFDKQHTYNRLPSSTIPTVSLENKSLTGIKTSLTKLNMLISLHPGKKDFSPNFVMKDRYGAGGENVFFIKRKTSLQDIATILVENKATNFIVQPFTQFKNGYQYKKISGFIDLRVIYLDGKAIQTYLRIATKKDFRCNEHQGGKLEYISLKELPTKVIKLANTIAADLNMKKSLYALDFIISDRGNVYLLEGNTGPGIDWNLSLKKNERRAKQFIRLIVSSIFNRINPQAEDYNLTNTPISVPLPVMKPQIFI